MKVEPDWKTGSPPVDGRYMVTTDETLNHHVTFAHYVSGQWYVEGAEAADRVHVLAWAEVPRGFQGSGFGND